MSTPSAARYASFGESTFVGREEDVLELTAFLQSGARLVTLFGPVGVGKTRLVHEIMTRVQADGGRSMIVSLAEVTGPDEVLTALAGALPTHAVGRRDLPTALRELARDALSGGPLLLVLDEFERLVPHATVIVDNLLASGEQLQLLVTSRELLRHPREQAYELLPLAVGPTTPGTSSPALQLMTERVRRYRRSFPDDPREAAAAEALIGHLDGIPLAIELVSPRVAMLGGPSVLDALRHRYVDHPTDSTRRGIDAAIEGSFALLPDDELRALIECAVFRGAFTIDAIEDVVDLPASTPAGIDLVHTFREKSLVARTEASTPHAAPRFRLYAPVRELASSRLTRHPDRDAVVARHASHYLSLAEGWIEQVDRLDGATALLELAAERENLEAVVDRALAAPPTPQAAEHAFRALLALAPLVFARGRLAPFARRLDLAVQRFERVDVPRRLLASVLGTRGRCLRRDGRSADAEADHTSALAIAHELEDRKLEASIQAELLLTKFARQRLDDAVGEWRQACQLATKAGDIHTEGVVLTRAAVALRERGMIDAAGPLAERALDLHRRSGNAAYEASTLGELALCALEGGDTGAAYDLVERALLIARASGNTLHLALVTGQRAMVRLGEGDLEGGVEDLEFSLGVLRDGGYTRFTAGALGYLGIAALERGDGEVAERLLTECRSIISKSVEIGYSAMFGAYLALARALRGDARGATELLAAATSAMPANDVFAPVLEVVHEHTQLVLGGKPTSRVVDLMSSPAATSLDMRIAVRLLRRATARLPSAADVPGRRCIQIASDGSSFLLLPAETTVDCRHRRSLSPILALLARARAERPGAPVSVVDLVRAGWPEQRTVSDAAKNRLRVALTHLRKLGLGDVLVWSSGGYALDPSVEITVGAPASPGRGPRT